MSEPVLVCKKCEKEIIKVKGRKLWYCPKNLNDPKYQSFWQPKEEKSSYRKIINFFEKMDKKLNKIYRKLSTF